MNGRWSSSGHIWKWMKSPLNVDNAIIHEEYLVGLHYNYYRNDPIKYLVATLLSSWGVNQYLLATKMSSALVES